MDTRRNIRNLLGMVPEMLAAMPLTLPVDEEMDSQVGEGPDVMWTGRDLDMGDPDVGRDIQMMSEVGPMMIDGSDTGPLALPVVANTETQVDVRLEVTLEVVPSMVDGGYPAGWLDSESDGCVMDEIVLAPEMSPFVFMKSAVVPTFLPALSEVCSLAVLAGGGPSCAAPLALVESVTARVSVLPDVGSELPTVYEVGNSALDVVGLRVGQSCL